MNSVCPFFKSPVSNRINNSPAGSCKKLIRVKRVITNSYFVNRTVNIVCFMSFPHTSRNRPLSCRVNNATGNRNCSGYFIISIAFFFYIQGSIISIANYCYAIPFIKFISQRAYNEIQISAGIHIFKKNFRLRMIISK